MHGHWFISLGQQEHGFLDSALHFIQITWFTYVFANIRRCPSGFNCRMQLIPSDIAISPDFLYCFNSFLIDWYAQHHFMTAVPPDHLRSEIPFSVTCNIPNLIWYRLYGMQHSLFTAWNASLVVRACNDYAIPRWPIQKFAQCNIFLERTLAAPHEITQYCKWQWTKVK